VIVDDDLAKSLRELVEFEKARCCTVQQVYRNTLCYRLLFYRSVMFGQWGFGKRMTQVGKNIVTVRICDGICLLSVLL
jgi:hypothetical protein